MVPVAREVVAERLREDRHAVDVAELALVGAEAHRRVALDVLDRAISLARGERDVGRRDVVLQVDELLGAASRRHVRRHDPERRERLFRRIVDDGRVRRRAIAEAGEARRFGARRKAFGNARAEREGPVAGAGRALGLHRRARHEARPVVVETRLASRLRVQMDDRAPPAGHRHEVARNGGRRARDAGALRVAHHHFHRARPASRPRRRRRRRCRSP